MPFCKVVLEKKGCLFGWEIRLCHFCGVVDCIFLLIRSKSFSSTCSLIYLHFSHFIKRKYVSVNITQMVSVSS